MIPRNPVGPNPPFDYSGAENWDKSREENSDVYSALGLRKILGDQWNSMAPEERPVKKIEWRRTPNAFVKQR
jgi:hypothetical protein